MTSAYTEQALRSRRVTINEIMIEPRTPSRLENIKNIRHLRSLNGGRPAPVPSGSGRKPAKGGLLRRLVLAHALNREPCSSSANWRPPWRPSRMAAIEFNLRMIPIRGRRERRPAHDARPARTDYRTGLSSRICAPLIPSGQEPGSAVDVVRRASNQHSRLLRHPDGGQDG